MGVSFLRIQPSAEMKNSFLFLMACLLLLSSTASSASSNRRNAIKQQQAKSTADRPSFLEFVNCFLLPPSECRMFPIRCHVCRFGPFDVCFPRSLPCFDDELPE